MGTSATGWTVTLSPVPASLLLLSLLLLLVVVVEAGGSGGRSGSYLKRLGGIGRGLDLSLM